MILDPQRSILGEPIASVTRRASPATGLWTAARADSSRCPRVIREERQEIDHLTDHLTQGEPTMAEKERGATERADNSNEDRDEYIRGYQGEGGRWAPTNSHRGRAASWVAVAFLVVGFALGGLSLVLGPSWWVLGAGVVLMAIGAVLCFTTDIFSDVVLDDPHHGQEERHDTPLHRIKNRDGGQRRTA